MAEEPTSVTGWERLGASFRGELTPARLSLHWAAQVVASAGTTLATPRADWSHTALAWMPGEGALVGATLAGAARAALRFEPFEIYVAGEAGVARGPAFPLAGRNLDEAMAWLGESLGKKLSWPAHELPASKLAEGAPFDGGPVEARRELGRWFGDAALALAPFAALPIGSPIRVWPHHFDIATLLTIAGEGERAETVGVGLSPGDESYAEPYWYVTPSPKPATLIEPPLRAGRWHTERWFGAVLPASSLLAAGGEQSSVVTAFLAGAVAAGRAMLER